MLYYTQYPSPLGQLLLTSDGEALTGLWIEKLPPAGAAENPALFAAAKAWLDAYFRGENRPIDFPIHMEGTPFRQKVWEMLKTIPYGSSTTYGAIARQLDENMSAQAVGGAVGRNPVSIIVPCHRVLGTGGRLTGYAFGLDKKKWLLDHESIPYREEEI